MSTRTKRPRLFSPADLRQRVEQADRDRAGRLIETIAPDRVCVRPSLLVVAVETKRRPQALDPDHPFSVTCEGGSIEFVTVRRETIPSAHVVSEERFDRRQVLNNRPPVSGLRLRVEKLSDAPLPSLRLYVGNADALATMLRRGEAWVGGDDQELHPARVTATGIEHADDLYPTPQFGCRGRSLLSAWFHAPDTLAFIDVACPETAQPSLDLWLLFRDPADARQLPSATIQTGCIPIRNDRIASAAVAVEPTRAFELIPTRDNEVVVGVGRVEAFVGEGQWRECRPWLGSLYDWGGGSDPMPGYVLSGGTGGTRPRIGLVEPRAGLDANGTHLNVQLSLAHPDAAFVATGAEAMGDKGERAAAVSHASPLLIPSEVEGSELAAETRANGWLSRHREGDVTEGLVAMLERAATGVRARGSAGQRPWTHDAAEWLRRATATVERCERFPLVSLELDLDWNVVEPRRGLLLAAVLERCLPHFAPPLAGTRLTTRTLDGECSWEPRWPDD